MHKIWHRNSSEDSFFILRLLTGLLVAGLLFSAVPLVAAEDGGFSKLRRVHGYPSEIVGGETENALPPVKNFRSLAMAQTTENGTILCVGDSENGLHILQSTSNNIVALGHQRLRGLVRDVVATDGVAFVITGRGMEKMLHIVDIHQPDKPELLDTLEIPQDTSSFLVHGSFLILACAEKGLLFYDISDSKKVTKQTVYSPKNFVPVQIAERENRLYVIDRVSPGIHRLTVLDIADLENIHLLNPDATEFDGIAKPVSLSVGQGYAVLADDGFGTHVFDTQDPAKIQILAQYEFSSNCQAVAHGALDASRFYFLVRGKGLYAGNIRTVTDSQGASTRKCRLSDRVLISGDLTSLIVFENGDITISLGKQGLQTVRDCPIQ